MRRFLICVLAAAFASVVWAARPGDTSGANGNAQKKGQSRKHDATPTPTVTPTPGRKLLAPSEGPSPNVSTEEKRDPKKSDKPEYDVDNPAVGPTAKIDIRKSLTGTFTLVLAGESPQDVAKRATQSLPDDKRAEVYEALVRRLQTPERLAIEQRGGKIKIASTAFAPVTLETNWSSKHGPISPYSAEYSAPPFDALSIDGGMDGELVIRASGLSNDDFFRAVFKPVESGRRLNITREVSVEGLPKPILIHSVYQRVSDTAKFDALNVQHESLHKTQSVPPSNKADKPPPPKPTSQVPPPKAPTQRGKP